MLKVLFGKLIDAVYTDSSTSTILAEFTVASILMGLLDAVGGASLDVAGARLGTRLQQFTFDVIVEQVQAAVTVVVVGPWKSCCDSGAVTVVVVLSPAHLLLLQDIAYFESHKTGNTCCSWDVYCAPGICKPALVFACV